MATSILEDSAVRSSTSPSQRLRTTMAAMRLSFTWFGVRKSLTTEQKAEAAEAFGAEGDVLSAGKRLINTKHPKYKAVTTLRNRALSYWKALSLPFPEPGIRLVKQDHIDAIDSRMQAFKGELLEQVDQLDFHYGELKRAARIRLGRLYDENDYPRSLVGLFDMCWDWPSVEPPPYLRQLSPSLYQEECRRVEARFDEAVRLAEGRLRRTAFAARFSSDRAFVGQRGRQAQDLPGQRRGEPDHLLRTIPGVKHPFQ